MQSHLSAADQLVGPVTVKATCSSMHRWRRYCSARTMLRMSCESVTGCKSFLSRMRALSGWRKRWMLSMS